MSRSKTWTPKPHLFPLEQTYTKLEWEQQQSRPGRVVREQISDVTDLLDEKQLAHSGPVRVLVTGEYELGTDGVIYHSYIMPFSVFLKWCDII